MGILQTVILLLFWGSNIQDADRVVQMTSELVKKFQGKPFTVIGVNQLLLSNTNGPGGVTVTCASGANVTVTGEAGCWLRVSVYVSLTPNSDTAVPLVSATTTCPTSLLIIVADNPALDCAL